MRSLADWLEFQQRQHPRAIDLQIGRVRAVAARLGIGRPAYPTVLVGGTNGKGSTVALVTALSRELGLGTGTYTSPHLERYNERVCIDGREAEDAELVAAFERIEDARGDVPLTFFEYGTLAAYDIFRARGIELGVIEVGLGGRLDATNAFDPDVAVLCTIGLDHKEFLGTSLESIGREKAGIFRAGRPAILGSADLPSSVAAAVAEVGAVGRWPGVHFGVQRRGGAARWSSWGWGWRFDDLPPPALHGEVQYANASTAIAATYAVLESRLPERLPDLRAERIARALDGVALRGRFQVVARRPEWILDVAHNPAAAAVLAGNLRLRRVRGRTIAVVGMLADKDVEGIAGAVAPRVDEWVLCSTDGPRALAAAELQRRIAPHGADASLCDSVAAGCALAAARAQPSDRIVVFGSFHTVGPALSWLRL